MNTPSSTSKTAPAAKSMAELLASQKSSFVTLHKGDVIEGRVTKLTSQEILIDIQAKTEAVVLEKDKQLLRNLLAALKLGDKVSVSVLSPESDLGHPIVSLRRFLSDNIWDKLAALQKSQESTQATITEVTRGGYVVSASGGISGFLPQSHATTINIADGESLIGKKISVYVLELQRAASKVIFSQKPMLSASDFAEATKEFKTGQKILGTVTNTTPFGIFVSLVSGEKKLDGLIHISELSWEKVAETAGLYDVGQEIETIIIGFDREAKRVDLSVKRLTENPFEAKLKVYSVDQAVEGKVKSVLPTGVSVILPDDVEGFIRKEKIAPTVVFREGDTVKATVAQIDMKRQRVMLVPVLAVKPLGYR